MDCNPNGKFQYILSLYDGISKKGIQGPVSGLIRAFIALLCGLPLLLESGILATSAYGSLIGPRAEIIIPDDFAGAFAVVPDSLVRPSIRTTGENFRYDIPADGLLRVKRGWINCGFWYDDGINVSKKYFTLIRRANGSPLAYREFACTWISRNSVVRVREDAADTYVSTTQILGLACWVGSGAGSERPGSNQRLESFADSVALSLVADSP